MELREATSAFAALAQPTRLKTLQQLIKAGPRGLAAGALSAAVGVPAPTMSFHLKELTAAGLAEARREGRRIFYAADYGGLRALIGFLMRDCCQGDPRLCGPYLTMEEAT